MIEILGLVYGVGKDLASYLQWSEEVKVVDRNWLDKSGFKDAMGDEGYNLQWVRIENCESVKLDGYETVYEVDKVARKRRSIERHGVSDKLILMGKRKP